MHYITHYFALFNVHYTLHYLGKCNALQGITHYTLPLPQAWMGLMCTRPRWTFFTVAVSRPIKDMNHWTGQAGQDRKSSIFCWRLCHRSGVGRTRPDLRLNWYPTKSKTCLGSRSEFSKFTSQPKFWHIFNRTWVCWRQIWWDLALTNQSSRYRWIITPLYTAISFTSFAITVNSMGAVDNPKGSNLNWYVLPWTWNLKIFPGLFLYWYMEVGILEVYWGDSLPLMEGGPDGFRGLHFEFLYLEELI